MNKFLNSLSKIIVDGYNNISEKAEEVTKIGRIKIEIIASKRDIEKLFVELGGRFYSNFNSKEFDFLKDKDITDLISKVKEKEKELESLKKRIEKIKKEDGIEVK
ncbi:MAG: hypothetical protein KAS18_09715 [Calditrichia bacterium]|nr:hypothetical protein [Calditrichia bacterium]